MEIAADMQSKPCHITMLGGFHAGREDSQPVEFLPQQPSALLAYLALHLQSNPTREELIEQLLAEEEPEQAQPKMRHYLHELRRRFEQPPFEQADMLITTRKTIRLDPDRVTTDVIAFEVALRVATRTTDLQERELHLAHAVQLYHGDLLPGFYQECFVTERHRLSHLYEHALLTLTSVYEQLGDLERALEYARRTIAIDPLKEEAHCSLMRLYAEMGQPSAVVKQYQELERILKEAFEEEPSPTTRQLMETLRERAQANVPHAVNGNGGNGKPHLTSLPFQEDTEHALDTFLEAPAPLPSRLSPAPWLRFLAPASLIVLLGALGYAVLHRREKPPQPAWLVPDAKLLWVARYLPAADEKADCEPTAMTTDAAGNIYITGFVKTLHHDVDYLTLKYDKDGKLLWRRRYNGPGNDVDRARSIAVDQEGNVYVTGDSDNGKGNGTTRLSGLDWATIKYDKDGKQLWVARYNSPDDGEDRPVKVCVDNQGFVYVAGYSIVRRYLNRGIWLRKQWEVVQYEPLRGRQMWVRHDRPPEDNLEAEAVDMAVGPAGDVYVTGNYATLLGVRAKTNVLTIKYVQNGDVIWRKTYSGKGFGDVFARRIVLDSSGNVTITGEQYDGGPENNGTSNDVVTLKYDADGNQLWTPQIYDNRLRDDSPDALAVDESGAVCVAGHTGPLINLDYLTLRYDPNGSLLWAHTYNGTANGVDHANNVAFDHAGNVIVSGYAQDAGAGRRPGKEAEPIIRGDNVTLKYDLAGRILWKGVYGTVWGPDTSLVAIDDQNGVIVSGQCNDRKQNLVITTIKYAPDADTGP